MSVTRTLLVATTGALAVACTGSVGATSNSDGSVTNNLDGGTHAHGDDGSTTPLDARSTPIDAWREVVMLPDGGTIIVDPPDSGTVIPDRDAWVDTSGHLDPSQFPVSTFRNWGTECVNPTSEEPSTADGTGNFRIECQYSHMSYNDPIVFPGIPGAAHLHTFFGNTSADAFSTHDSLRAAGNSTCTGGTVNRTAYWIPTLLENGRPLAPSTAIFYYKSGYHGVQPQDIEHIPDGLKMIAGDMHASGPHYPFPVGWGCHNNYVPATAEIQDCQVGDEIELAIFFPQCWDGVNLDSADHKSHMAYPDQSTGCPASHPVALPEISQHIRWTRTAGMNIRNLRLSSDMYDTSLPGGYSAHADYLEAWNPDVRNAFTDNCTSRPNTDCHAHLLGDGRMLGCGG
jgi:Domain of unknown function (DUF1996)